MQNGLILRVPDFSQEIEIENGDITFENDFLVDLFHVFFEIFHRDELFGVISGLLRQFAVCTCDLTAH